MRIQFTRGGVVLFGVVLVAPLIIGLVLIAVFAGASPSLSEAFVSGTLVFGLAAIFLAACLRVTVLSAAKGVRGAWFGSPWVPWDRVATFEGSKVDNSWQTIVAVVTTEGERIKLGHYPFYIIDSPERHRMRLDRLVKRLEAQRPHAVGP